jgi:hypothetical protein
MSVIYVIFHITFEDTNVFTLDESKITEIIQKQTEKRPGTIGEWRWRKIVEGEDFEADMNTIPLFHNDYSRD